MKPPTRKDFSWAKNVNPKEFHQQTALACVGHLVTVLDCLTQAFESLHHIAKRVEQDVQVSVYYDEGSW